MRLAAVLALLAVLAPCRTDDAEAIISRNLNLAAAATAAEPEPDVDVASPEDDFEAFDAAAAARGPDKSPWFRRRLESSPDAQESLADLAQAAQAAALSDTPDDAADDETTRRLVDLLRARSTKARPPIFLVPGICSTRLMTWRKQKCRGPDLNVQVCVRRCCRDRHDYHQLTLLSPHARTTCGSTWPRSSRPSATTRGAGSSA